MDAVLAFILGTGGLIAGGVLVMFAIGWYILVTRAKKFKATT
jgi:hypothetical protein